MDPKNNLAAHSGKGEVQSRLERGAHCSARQVSMESTCGGPMRHLGARGQVKVKGLRKETLIERFKIIRNDSSKPLFSEKKMTEKRR